VRRPILLPALLAISAPLAAQSPAISVDTLKEVTQTLSSDTFEGRAPTTPAEGLTIGYIAGRLSAAGIKPGNKGDWFQKVPMVELNADSAMHLDISGGAQPLSFAYKTDMVATSYRVVPETRIANSDVVFVGYGINAPELGWNDYAGVDMKGKTAVILVNDPDYAPKTQNGPFKAAHDLLWPLDLQVRGSRAAGRGRGLIVHDTFPAAYGWSVVNSSWTGAQYYVQTSGRTTASGPDAGQWLDQKPVTPKRS
jgi:hypothetical protein